MRLRTSVAGTVLIIGSLTLAACGETPGCRALTGGAIGAAGGAALGAIGGNPALGALAGGAAGAGTGAFTSPGIVNAGPSPVCY